MGKGEKWEDHSEIKYQNTVTGIIINIIIITLIIEFKFRWAIKYFNSILFVINLADFYSCAFNHNVLCFIS